MQYIKSIYIMSVIVISYCTIMASDDYERKCIFIDEKAKKFVNSDWLKEQIRRHKKKNFFLKEATKCENEEKQYKVQDIIFDFGKNYPVENGREKELSVDNKEWAIFEISYCEDNSQEIKKFLLYCSDVGTVSKDGRCSCYYGMFSNSKLLKNIKQIGGDVSDVGFLNLMFSSCENLNEVFLDKFNITKTTMCYIFLNCKKLKKVVLFNNVESLTNECGFSEGFFFENCTNLEIIETNFFLFSKAHIGFWKKLPSLKILKFFDPQGKSKKYFTSSWFFSKFKICEEKDDWISYTPNGKSLSSLCPC